MRLLEAQEFRAMGKPREALRAIEAAMAWDPTNPMLVNEKGVLEYQLGRFAGRRGNSWACCAWWREHRR